MEGIKLICLDVDGTLLDSHHLIPSRNKEALQEAQRKGIMLALVSGRLPTSLRQIQKQLGITGPLGCFNGALVLDEKDNALDENPITRQQASDVIKTIRPWDMPMFLFDKENWYSEQRNKWTTLEERISCTGNFVESFGKVLDDAKDIYKIICMSDNERELKACVQSLSKKFDTTVDAYLSSPTYGEVSSKGIHKGNAVKVLCRHFGIPKRQCMAIGDYFNDIGMFEEAGYSVAMGNAPQEVKDKATVVTKTNDETGLGKAIRDIL
ncbi:MAG: Cof-type HAD-IIB family hydrolase [Sphaerochaetaceae bacterium]